MGRWAWALADQKIKRIPKTIPMNVHLLMPTISFILSYLLGFNGSLAL
jgi:hypothetical protein